MAQALPQEVINYFNNRDYFGRLVGPNPYYDLGGLRYAQISSQMGGDNAAAGVTPEGYIAYDPVKGNYGDPYAKYDQNGNYAMDFLFSNPHDINDMADSLAPLAAMVAMAYGGGMLASGAGGAGAGAAAGTTEGIGGTLSKAALDGTTAFGANSAAGALDISALSAAAPGAASAGAVGDLAAGLGYAAPAVSSTGGLSTGGAGTAAAGAGGAGGGGAAPAASGGLLNSLGQYAGPLASVVSGAIGANAADKAADAQTDAANNALALQRDMFNKSIELQEPFRQGGISGLNKLLDLYGLSGNTGAEGYGSAMKDFSMADFQADPGYAFRLSEGQKALERSAAARGGLLSGRAAKDTLRFGQDMGSQEYGNAFNRYQINRSNKLNSLQSLMGAGQTATNQQQSAAQNYGVGGSNSLADAGNARASGYVGTANAVNNAIGQGWNWYQDNRLLNKLGY